MSSEESRKANELRKEGKFEEASKKYSYLWESSKDPYIGAGYLHCLRKLNQFNDALILAKELKKMHQDHFWVKKELLWTYIQGELKENITFNRAKELSTELLELEPDDLALKIITRRMIKISIKEEEWREANNWLNRRSKESLTNDNIGDSEWTEKTYWYYNKIKSLFELGESEECISYCDESATITKPRKTENLIIRMKAKALGQLSRFEEASKIYEVLCQGRTDWWLLHEYAKILHSMGKKVEALKLMYKAASSFGQLDKLVSLFNDIGELCIELGYEKEALAHFLLEKTVRTEKEWNIKINLETKIKDLLEKIPQFKTIDRKQDLISICRKIWKQSGVNIQSNEKNNKNLSSTRKTRKNLRGIIQIKDVNRPFYFIQSENESIICFKSEIDSEFLNGDIVIFDAKPSFDKKKQKESWKAVNVRKFKIN